MKKIVLILTMILFSMPVAGQVVINDSVEVDYKPMRDGVTEGVIMGDSVATASNVLKGSLGRLSKEQMSSTAGNSPVSVQTITETYWFDPYMLQMYGPYVDCTVENSCPREYGTVTITVVLIDLPTSKFDIEGDFILIEEEDIEKLFSGDYDEFLDRDFFYIYGAEIPADYGSGFVLFTAKAEYVESHVVDIFPNPCYNAAMILYPPFGSDPEYFYCYVPSYNKPIFSQAHVEEQDSNTYLISWDAGTSVLVRLRELHFNITFAPDTIHYNESASIHVQAMSDDGDTTYLPPDEQMLISICDEEEYGQIMAPDSSYDWEFDEIPYIDLKNGEYQYVANDKKPEDYVNIQMAVITLYDLASGCIDDCISFGTLVLAPDRSLDHFEVTFEKDTISHGDTTGIFVQCMDLEGNDIDPAPEGLMVKFSLDDNGENYGEFIGYDTIGVTYNHAEGGGVKYVANGVEPDSAKTVTIKVQKKDDPDVEGEGRLVVKPAIKITIRFGKEKLKPLLNTHNKTNPKYNKNGPDTRKNIADFSKVDTTQLIVTVTEGKNKSKSNYSFRIQALARPKSGGHAHRGNRPFGRFVTLLKDTSSNLISKTDSIGKAVFTYLCSGIGGMDSIFVKGIVTNDSASAVIPIKIDSLKLLTEGGHYNLVGETGTHPVNHYGTQNLINKLKALADSAYADSSYIFQYNDMSLIHGGLFDCYPTIYPWNTPHQAHREGTNVDVDDMDGKGKKIDLKYFKELIKNAPFFGKFLNEGNHYHITF